MDRHKYLLIGGDKRQEFLFDLFKNEGKNIDSVFLFTEDDEKTAKEKIENSDVIVLPIPSCVDGINLFAPNINAKIPLLFVLDNINENTILFSGGENSAIIASKARRKINLLADESMTLKNAMATAEAAVSIIINETEKTVFKSNIIIIGYGRIAKILADYLLSLKAQVTICARKDTAKITAELNGCKAIGFDVLKEKLLETDVVINTVPALILDEKELDLMKKSAFVLDLASKPGGINFEAAKRKNIKTLHALSLPGKFSPLSAAEYIKKSINGIIT